MSGRELFGCHVIQKWSIPDHLGGKGESTTGFKRQEYAAFIWWEDMLTSASNFHWPVPASVFACLHVNLVPWDVWWGICEISSSPCGTPLPSQHQEIYTTLHWVRWTSFRAGGDKFTPRPLHNRLVVPLLPPAHEATYGRPRAEGRPASARPNAAWEGGT